jgi:hypothetical protein
MEKLGRRPLPGGAEAWFAIPRWQALAPSYNEALEMVLNVVGKQRKLSNRVMDKLGPDFLRQSERSLCAREILLQQQSGNDVTVVAAQAGMLHRLGAFSFACMLLTHPERLSSLDALMVDCCGDEYSLRGDRVFDRVPLFDYDLGGLQFSIFYEDRSRSMWGSPSCFLFQMT